jgi:hypothetical protein
MLKIVFSRSSGKYSRVAKEKPRNTNTRGSNVPKNIKIKEQYNVQLPHIHINIEFTQIKPGF